jgi:hypothetical protein
VALAPAGAPQQPDSEPLPTTLRASAFSEPSGGGAGPATMRVSAIAAAAAPAPPPRPATPPPAPGADASSPPPAAAAPPPAIPAVSEEPAAAAEELPPLAAALPESLGADSQERAFGREEWDLGLQDGGADVHYAFPFQKDAFDFADWCNARGGGAVRRLFARMSGAAPHAGAAAACLRRSHSAPRAAPHSTRIAAVSLCAHD